MGFGSENHRIFQNSLSSWPLSSPQPLRSYFSYNIACNYRVTQPQDRWRPLKKTAGQPNTWEKRKKSIYLMTYLCLSVSQVSRAVPSPDKSGNKCTSGESIQVTWFLLNLLSTTYWFQMVWLLEYLFLWARARTHTHTEFIKLAPHRLFQMWCFGATFYVVKLQNLDLIWSFP